MPDEFGQQCLVGELSWTWVWEGEAPAEPSLLGTDAWLGGSLALPFSRNA